MTAEAGAEPPEVDEADFYRRWRTSKPPFRPAPELVAQYRELLPETDDLVLLLGVTPELAVLRRHVLAVDASPGMIAQVWPGDTADRKAVLGDWRKIPAEPGTVAAVMADGSLNGLFYPDDQRTLFDQLRRMLRPGGRGIFRMIVPVEPQESIAALADEAMGGSLSFHGFKLRFGPAVAAEAGTPVVTCGQVIERFDRLFPDREPLSRASGWSLETIAEMDAYRAVAATTISFPSRSQLAALPAAWAKSVRFVETHGYPCAEWCPLLVVDAP